MTSIKLILTTLTRLSASKLYTEDDMKSVIFRKNKYTFTLLLK
jgi:hypothetical protein